MVKLVPPYLKTDVLKWNGSPVKDHTAIRHRIYVEVEGIWLYEPGNRNVISKNFVDPARTISPYVSSVTRRSVGDGRLRILAKPGPQYTEAARANGINGTVRLRVTFLASGEIGPIEVVNGLSDGLTEQAIDAAKRIRFMPEKQNGRAVSVRKLVEFSFNLY